MTISTEYHQRIKSAVKNLEKFADRSWYAPLIAILAALDNIIIIIPNDGILIASSILVPRRWILFAVSIAIGSTIGALLLAALVKFQGLPWILNLYPGMNETSMWIWTENFFGKYGLLLVFAVSISPLMQQPVIILAAMSSASLIEIAALVFAGRLIKFLAMAFLGSHSPKVLKRIWGLKDELKDAGVKID